MAIDTNAIGQDFSSLSSVVSGVDEIVKAAPGGTTQQQESGSFSLSQLSDGLKTLGGFFDKFSKPQVSPQSGPAPTSPVTGLPVGFHLPTWAPIAIAGVAGLLLVVVLFRRR